MWLIQPIIVMLYSHILFLLIKDFFSSSTLPKKLFPAVVLTLTERPWLELWLGAGEGGGVGCFTTWLGRESRLLRFARLLLSEMDEFSAKSQHSIKSNKTIIFLQLALSPRKRAKAKDGKKKYLKASALNVEQRENAKITQAKCWNYFKTSTQAGNVFWVNMGL